MVCFVRLSLRKLKQTARWLHITLKSSASAYAFSLCLVVALMCASCHNKADDAKAADDAIRQQISRYTAALDAADTGLASQVWKTSGDISFIHPMGHAHGWDEIKKFYDFFGSAFSERKLTARDISVHINGDAAWAEFYWHFVAKQRNDGAVVQTDGRETQIYNKAGNQWRLVHVHYSSPATPR